MVSLPWRIRTWPSSPSPQEILGSPDAHRFLEMRSLQRNAQFRISFRIGEGAKYGKQFLMVESDIQPVAIDSSYTNDEPADYWAKRGYSRYDGIQIPLRRANPWGPFSGLQYALAFLRLGQVFGAFSSCCRDLPECPHVGKKPLGNDLAVNKLSFALASDEPGFAEDFEMVRDRRRRHTSQGDDFTARHLVGCRDRLQYPEPSFVSQRLRYFFNFRKFHVLTQV